MENTGSYGGGWFSNRQTATGATSVIKTITKYFVAATIVVSAGTGAFADDLKSYQKKGLNEATIKKLSTFSCDDMGYRSPSEDIQRIRDVLSPAISDLAKSFNVSRQTIYNWLNGEQPKDEHSVRIQDLALASDILFEAGISVNGQLLKRKVMQGKNLFEHIRDGGSAQEAAQLLVQIIKTEAIQRARLSSRFAGRKSTLSSADSDLMAENDAV